jgi:hypothetical protein
MNTVKIIVLSSVIAIVIVVILENIGIIPSTAYDCNSSHFNEFPSDVQDQCIQILEQDLRELFEKQIIEEHNRKLINV